MQCVVQYSFSQILNRVILYHLTLVCCMNENKVSFNSHIKILNTYEPVDGWAKWLIDLLTTLLMSVYVNFINIVENIKKINVFSRKYNTSLNYVRQKVYSPILVLNLYSGLTLSIQGV